jgi:hypothetical protein
MKNLVSIFIAFLLSSCGISGLYYNKNWNKHSPDALFIELCGNGTFKFYVWQDILGEGLESGIWHRRGDTIIFEATKRFNPPMTKVYSEIGDSYQSRLTFYAVHAIGDTIQLGMLDSLIIQDKSYPLDSTGTVYLDSITEGPIQIKPWSLGMLNLTDTIFHLDPTKNEFDFYISRGEWQPFSYYMIEGKMLLKGNKLFDIDSTGKLHKDFPWTKHKRGCGHLKESGT